MFQPHQSTSSNFTTTSSFASAVRGSSQLSWDINRSIRKGNHQPSQVETVVEEEMEGFKCDQCGKLFRYRKPKEPLDLC